MHTAFAFREVPPGDGFELGPFRVKTEHMEHLGLPALGYRIEADGQVLAYTGDSGPTHHIETLAKGADVLLAEATWQDRDDLLPFHMSARQAAAHARESGVGRLILTHIWPTLDRQRSLEQASEEWDGPIELATEGARLEVEG
jgi:ribonuclease BN (tRNA processing enzyme)